MEDVFRRRTQKFQNITARFSKVNGFSDNKNDVDTRISFLKQVNNNTTDHVIKEEEK